MLKKLQCFYFNAVIFLALLVKMLLIGGEMDKYCKAVYKFICLDAYRGRMPGQDVGFTGIKKIEIARILGIDRNTVARKVKVLMAMGLVSKEEKYFRVDIPEEFEGCDINEKFNEIMTELKG